MAGKIHIECTSSFPCICFLRILSSLLSLQWLYVATLATFSTGSLSLSFSLSYPCNGHNIYYGVMSELAIHYWLCIWVQIVNCKMWGGRAYQPPTIKFKSKIDGHSHQQSCNEFSGLQSSLLGGKGIPQFQSASSSSHRLYSLTGDVILLLIELWVYLCIGVCVLYILYICTGWEDMTTTEPQPI